MESLLRQRGWKTRSPLKESGKSGKTWFSTNSCCSRSLVATLCLRTNYHHTLTWAERGYDDMRASWFYRLSWGARLMLAFTGSKVCSEKTPGLDESSLSCFRWWSGLAGSLKSRVSKLSLTQNNSVFRYGRTRKSRAVFAYYTLPPHYRRLSLLLSSLAANSCD